MQLATKMKILSIFGTRPEAIKMAPLMRQLALESEVESIICTTGQHRSMLDQVLRRFDIAADHDLDLMVPNQSLNELTARLFNATDKLLATVQPDRVLVHGDTTSAMVASMAAFQRKIPVAHIEAGLRTRDMAQPWPEEMNRRIVDVISDLMFAPTNSSRDNLLAECLGGRIVVSGNTVIDALQLCVKHINDDALLRESLDRALPIIQPGKKLLLVTGHRRENFGQGFSSICDALSMLSRRPDIQIVYPLHLNPNVRDTVLTKLTGLPNVDLIEPLDYFQFVRLMQQAHVIMTDSGGVQEEAPSLGKPVLVMRDVTERPEAVAAGTVELVGTNPMRIANAVNRLFDDSAAYQAAAFRQNPYGDGRASERIVAALVGRPMADFANAETWPAREAARFRT